MRFQHYDRDHGLGSVCLAKHYGLRLLLAVAMLGITTPHLSAI
jgi:hypothetical protein